MPNAWIEFLKENKGSDMKRAELQAKYHEQKSEKTSGKKTSGKKTSGKKTSGKKTSAKKTSAKKTSGSQESKWHEVSLSFWFRAKKGSEDAGEKLKVLTSDIKVRKDVTFEVVNHKRNYATIKFTCKGKTVPINITQDHKWVETLADFVGANLKPNVIESVHIDEDYEVSQRGKATKSAVSKFRKDVTEAVESEREETEVDEEETESDEGESEPDEEESEPDEEESESEQEE